MVESAEQLLTGVVYPPICSDFASLFREVEEKKNAAKRKPSV